MSFFKILETLLIGPLKLIFEIIFELANRFVDNPGIAIVFLSLIMNILVLPLYKRADLMQERSRDIEAKLQKGVAHIKKTFSGDERMMILQTYYKQNNYKPTNALNGSVSLLLEIPFFMAAYQFLSNLEILHGVSLGPIADLGAPDGLLTIGGFSINLLPFVMTLINVISSALYLKGYPLKTKIQLYAMALFFLVFLYTSPAGLLFYWTLNNLFSLVKTIFYKLKNPAKVLSILTAIIGVGLAGFGAFVYETESLKRKVFVIALGVILVMPLIISFVKPKLSIKPSIREPKPNRTLFVLGALFLTILIGVLIPSAYISASPQEYVDVSYFHNPLWYIVSCASLAAGTFLVWFGVFYWLASPKGKELFGKAVWVLSGITIVNYMFFGTKLGVISSILQYEDGMSFTRNEQLINLLVIIVLAGIMYLCASKWQKVVVPVLLTAVIAIGGMSAVNLWGINSSINEIYSDNSGEAAEFNLSTTGQNVVVIMLDRAMGEYVPYIMNEYPEIKEQFSGFTHYSNTLSYGGFTNFGSPALVGGYEYTPVELNARDDELLVDKHNEALKVMPVLFLQNGFDVTVCDPPYAGYKWIPDLSVYDDYPEIDAYNTKGNYGDVEAKKAVVENNHRNFFCFAVMKSMPLVLQPTIYNDGLYNQTDVGESEQVEYTTQTMDGLYRSSGIRSRFMDSYEVLCNLNSITKITEDSKNTFLFMANETTHEPNLLQLPGLTPAMEVDNTDYPVNEELYTLNGKTLAMNKETHLSHYHINVVAYKLLGQWFDYLRENGVYDNTRIILVSDHGRNMNQLSNANIAGADKVVGNIELYYPLLMVKDYGEDGFTVSEEFMTNADVPTIATENIISAPVNPFTGNAINNSAKSNNEHYVILSEEWDVKKNNGNTFNESQWAIFSGNNILEPENWKLLPEKTVMKAAS